MWLGYRKPNGYGEMGIGRKVFLAHRVAYELFVGPIPDGMTLDHKCRERACVNPDHLEPVTNRENILRGISPSAQNAHATHCTQGHPFDDENTYSYTWDRTGQKARICKACNLARAKERYCARMFIAWWGDAAVEACLDFAVKKGRVNGRGGRRIPWRVSITEGFY